MPVEIGLIPIEAEESIFALAAIVDITEGKIIEAAIDKSQARMHAALAAGGFFEVNFTPN